MSEMPHASRASVLNEYDTDPAVQEIPVPEVGPGGVLIKVEASTMCGTESHVAHGMLSNPAGVFQSKPPIILGHEIVGRVVKLGEGRTVDALNRSLGEGDMVAFTYARCGSCYWCTIAGQPTLCENSALNYGYGPADQYPYLTGGFSEYVYALPQCKIVKVPDNLDPAVAASATCAFRTIVHAFERIGQLQTSDTVVIQGSGAVGLFAVAHARQSGAAKVIVIGNPADRLAIAEKWGADETMDFTEVGPETRQARVLQATEGRGADVVVECSGAQGALEESLRLVRRGGKVALVGVGAPKPAGIDVTAFVTREISLLGSAGGDIVHYYRALQFMSDFADKYSFADLLGGRYGLADVPLALAAIRSQTEIKPVIVPSL